MLSQGSPSPPEWSFSQKRNALSGFFSSTLLLSEASSIRRIASTTTPNGETQQQQHNRPGRRRSADWSSSSAQHWSPVPEYSSNSRIPLAEHSYLIYSLYSDANFTLTTHLVDIYQKIKVLLISHSYSTNDQPLNAQHIATIVDW